MFLRTRVSGHGGGRKIDNPKKTRLDPAGKQRERQITVEVRRMSQLSLIQRWPGLLVFLGTLALGGCDQPVSTPPPSSQENQLSSTQSGVAPDSRKRQADFLNRIRTADPEHRTIDRAMLNAQNELGLVLDRSVEMDRVPDLMRSILAQIGARISRPGSDYFGLHVFQSTAQNRDGAFKSADARDDLHSSTVIEPIQL